jgi:hypothetical protein
MLYGLLRERDQGHRTKMLMNDGKPPINNQDIEITDLDSSGTSSRSSRFVSIALNRRYRYPLTFVTAALVLLAMLLVFVSSDSVRSLLSGSGGSLNAQPTQPSSYSYLVEADPPWGHLLVDGHSAHFYPVQGFQSIMLANGRHELTWVAAPFATQWCVLSVPPESGVDTCEHPESFFNPNGEQRSVGSIIVFQASLSFLSPALRAELVQAAQDALDLQQSSETVQPGEAYAISSLAFQTASKPCALTLDQSAAICYQSARQPLQATVSFQLDTDTTASGPCAGGECLYNGEDCRLFCDAPAYFDTPQVPSSPAQWNTFAIAHILWQYRTPQGQLIVPIEADSFIWGQQDEHLVPFNVTWDGVSWHVTTSLANQQAPVSNPMCDAANNDIVTLLFRDPSIEFTVISIPAPTFALGCLIEVQQVSLPATPTPAASASTAFFLHRFGVLVAVDAPAHHLLPFVPVADGFEMQLAEQLGAH